MPKKYLKKNVYEAAMERYDFIFTEFDNIYFSVSGGKDSGLMWQLGLQKAKEHNKKIDMLYIDLEAQYKATIDYVYELIENDEYIGTVYWICLPISLRNAVSQLQPKWTCWNKNKKDLWVREMPDNKWVINENNCKWDWFRPQMEFEEFIILFAEWYYKQFGKSAAGIGIRSNESLNRFRTIVRDDKTSYKDKHYTTQIRKNDKPIPVYNFYPLYDWTAADVWGAISKFNLKFNEIYELMYKNGLSIYEQRLCQPYGDDQRDGLDQYKALEPETWEKVLNRVNGVNFGNIYARTSLLGHMSTEKPDEMSWEQYAVFLLESIRIYAPELEQHYYKKIKKFMKWWEEEENIEVDNFYDEGKTDEEGRNIPSFQRIAQAIEKNDFWMKRLSFSQTKSDVERLNKLKDKYKKILGDGDYGKDLQRWKEDQLNGG
ncbi:MAG: DUF3440 domain-containing protein [Halanaerobiales bacterium]|nr:DUF3440 domain-containing protein [Halanaerobiales bacterium]